MKRLALASLLFCAASAYADDLPGAAFLQTCAKGLDAPAALDAKQPNPLIEALRQDLGAGIIGQQAAVDTIADNFELIQAFLNDPEKPMMRLLMVGPTGVGKTELARLLVKFFGGNPDVHMIRLDGGELQGDHEIAKVYGAPPGYKGHGEKPMLHPDFVLAARVQWKQPDGTVIEFTVILADEIEKMSDAAAKLFLGVLDNGQVTLGDQTKSPLRKTLIIGTSNQGATDVVKLIDQREAANNIRRAAGQTLTEAEADLTGRIDLEFRAQIFETYKNALKKKFAPEFLNRWQKIVQLLHLTRPEFLQIADIMLAKVQKRIFERAKYNFAYQVTPAAKAWLVDKGTDFRNGARELASVIEFELTRPLARLIATDQAVTGDVLVVDVEGGELTFKKIGAGLSEDELKRYADQVYTKQKMLKVKFAVAPGESIEEKQESVRGLLHRMREVPQSLASLMSVSTESKLKQENVGMPSEVKDILMYKIISVDGLFVRLQYSTVEAREAGAEAIMPVKAELLTNGLKPEDAADYSDKTLHQTTSSTLEQLLKAAAAKKSAP